MRVFLADVLGGSTTLYMAPRVTRCGAALPSKFPSNDPTAAISAGWGGHARPWVWGSRVDDTEQPYALARRDLSTLASPQRGRGVGNSTLYLGQCRAHSRTGRPIPHDSDLRDRRRNTSRLCKRCGRRRGVRALVRDRARCVFTDNAKVPTSSTRAEYLS